MSNLFYSQKFEYYFDKIKNGEHFKYSRYNDGELTAIIGDRPNKSNCDGHQYFPDMSVELKQILINYKESDDYVLESFEHWYDTLPHIKKVLNDLKSHNPQLSFLKDDFIRISHERDPKSFIKLLDVLKTKKLVLVAPFYLGALRKFFDFNHITVPRKNCYLEKDEVIRQIDEARKSKDNYFLFSASMPTKIMIDTFKDDTENTYLDWGSVWDTFFVSEEYNFIRKRSSSNKEKYKEIYKDYLL